MFSTMLFELPQAIVDQALTLGGNGGNSRYRIVSHFRKDFPIEENRAFLMREYGTGGRGFTLNGQQYAVWWNAEGLRVAQGTTARSADAISIPYDRAAARIRMLLDVGRYMSRDELGLVDQVELRELAGRIVMAYRDDLPGAQISWKNGSYPDEQAQVEELLADPVSRDRLILRLETDIANPASYDSTRKRWHDLGRLQADVRALQRVPLVFSGQTPIQTPEGFFITQDEIDGVLSLGSATAGGKGRIYDFFTAAHTEEERIDFLKREYGTGGRSLSHIAGGFEEHDGRGITIKSGSLMQPDAQATLKWRQAARRISELIDRGWYLTADEMDQAMQRREAVELPVSNDAAELPVTEQSWLDDMLTQHRDDLARRVVESPRFQTALGSADSENFRMEVENIIEEIASGLAAENIDLYRAYYDYPEFREPLHDYVLRQAQKEYGERPASEVASIQENPESPEPPRLEPDDAPEVWAAIDEYNRQKQAHPDSIVLVQVGGHYETYGQDAERMAQTVGSKSLTRSIAEGMSAPMTGFDPASQWRYYLKQLCDRGHSVLLRGLSDSGEYETVQEVNASEYVPLRAELKIEGHDYRVESVSRLTGTVSLQDLTLFASGYPLFRNEPIGYVRELLEAQDYFFSDHWRQLSEANAPQIQNDSEPPAGSRVSNETRTSDEVSASRRVSNDTRLPVDDSPPFHLGEEIASMQNFVGL